MKTTSAMTEIAFRGVDFGDAVRKRGDIQPGSCRERPVRGDLIDFRESCCRNPVSLGDPGQGITGPYPVILPGDRYDDCLSDNQAFRRIELIGFGNGFDHDSVSLGQQIQRLARLDYMNLHKLPSLRISRGTE